MSATDRHGRTLKMVKRRVGEGDELLVAVIPEATHVGLSTIASRNGIGVDVLVRQVLDRLANDLGGAR